MRFDWPEYRLRRDGLLVDRYGPCPFQPATVRFKSADEAEAWLIANNIRGNVRD